MIKETKLSIYRVDLYCDDCGTKMEFYKRNCSKSAKLEEEIDNSFPKDCVVNQNIEIMNIYKCNKCFNTELTRLEYPHNVTRED